MKLTATECKLLAKLQAKAHKQKDDASNQLLAAVCNISLAEMKSTRADNKAFWYQRAHDRIKLALGDLAEKGW